MGEITEFKHENEIKNGRGVRISIKKCQQTENFELPLEKSARADMKKS